MTSSRLERFRAVLMGAALLAGCAIAPSLLLAREAPAASPTTTVYGKVPIHFEPNLGQTDSRVRFLARGADSAIFLTDSEAVLSLAPGEGGPSLLRLRMLGANPAPRVTGAGELPARSNYLIGNDPARWRVGVPNYGRVVYEQVYPGVDLVFYGNQRQLEYDFVMAPGADPASIRMVWEGAERLALDAEGNLVIHAGAGRVVQQAPRIYQEREGRRDQIAGGYLLTGVFEVGFRVASYDRGRPLVIDPVLFYSTYLGGELADLAFGIAVDNAGSAYVAGITYSAAFPTLGPYQGSSGGGTDAFVAKFNLLGALVYSTYLGGDGNDIAWGIALDGSGNAYVTGGTQSTDFPTVGAYQTAQGGTDAFVSKLGPSGNTLVYSSYLGGSDQDEAKGIAVDGSGSAFLVGSTRSTDFPTTVGAFQTAKNLFHDLFVTKLSAAGDFLVYSTYLGGETDDTGAGIAVDAAGCAHVIGTTFDGGNYPTVGPSPATSGLRSEVAVSKLAASGSALLHSSSFGSEGYDRGQAIAVDGSGNAYLTGFAATHDFPTGGSLQSFGGDGDAFVMKLDDTPSLIYSTFLGGSDNESGSGIAVDGAGNLYVTGETASSDFPVIEPIQGDDVGTDVFVTKLNAAGSAFAFSTYLGGDSDDFGGDVALGPGSSVWVTGRASNNFPLENPYQASTLDGEDAFVARIDPSPIDAVPALSQSGVVALSALLLGAAVAAIGLRRRAGAG